MLRAVDQEACRLAKDEHGISTVDGISEQQEASKEAEYQNVSGTMLARAFWVAIHCTRKRIENKSCAAKPMESQIRSSLA